MEKKREILPTINNCVSALIEMSVDAAKLEITDNNKSSKRLKLSIARFKKNELQDLTNLVFSVRAEINAIPPKTKKLLNGKPMSVNFVKSVKPPAVEEDIDEDIDEEEDSIIDDEVFIVPAPEQPDFEF